MVQWLELYASIAEGMGLILGCQTKTMHAMQHSQKNFFISYTKF